MSYNKIILVGRLVRDPELNYVGNNRIPVCTFTLAVNRIKQGEVDYIRVKVWNKIGENCAQYLSKGQQAMVEGELNINKHESQGTTTYYTEVRADKVVFLSKSGSVNTNYAPNAGTEGANNVGGYEPTDIPAEYLNPGCQDGELTYKNKSSSFGGNGNVPTDLRGNPDVIPF